MLARVVAGEESVEAVLADLGEDDESVDDDGDKHTERELTREEKRIKRLEARVERLEGHVETLEALIDRLDED